MTHEIYLEASDFPNSKVLRIYDTSHYCEEDADNYLIEILPVNKTRWLTFHVKKGFSLALNSSSLGYKKVASSEELRSIPDGIYEIKQSYKPNKYTVQHYLHLRIVDTRLKIQKEWDTLVDNKCNLSREEFYKNRDRLREIDEYLLAAKYKIEECHVKKEGKEMYEWAIKLLEQYTNECQC